jgi:predicted secreted acid phosphatase
MSGMLLPAALIVAGVVLLTSDSPSVEQPLARARRLATEILTSAPRGSAVVFDFDDTLFDPHAVIDHIHADSRDFSYGAVRKAVPLYRPIRPICDTLRFAVAHGMYVILITARPDNRLTRATVLANLRHQKLTIHELHASKDYPLHTPFKAKLRAQINQRRRIALTIGDQWGDVNAADGYHWIKLPTRREPLLLSSLPEKAR